MARLPLVLTTGIVAISFAAPLFRKAAPTHPLAAAGIRLVIAAVLLSPLVWRAARAGRLRPLLGLGVLGGLAYSVHFGAWVWSLGLTTVAASVTLVTTTPLLLAVVALLTGRDRPSSELWGALTLAAVGVTLIGGHDLGGDTRALLGDSLAVLGAGAMAAFLLVGRRLPADADLLAFMGLATAVGGALLLGSAVALGLPAGPASTEALLYLGLAAVVSQLVGHGCLTWCLRHATPTVVGMATVAEPVGASLLAWAWLGEGISGQVALGCLATIAAVGVAVRAR